MPTQHLDLFTVESQDQLAAALQALRAELEVPPEFPADVLAEAERAVAALQLPAEDLTRLPFVTIDPPSSTDLDQALYIERADDGFRIWYAIADVPAFVEPGGALDAETRRRGQTIYAPDGRIPLHPEIISEAAGSLLPDQLRSAYVWELLLDAEGRVRQTQVRRARVRSRAKLNYEQVQQDIDSGGASGNLMLLKEVGLLRVALEQERGGASLNLPDQEIAHDGERYFIVTRPSLPVEDWNAQISLMTGMAAAELMLEGKVGVLRTMPEPGADAIDKFRKQAAALGRPWDEGLPYGQFLRSLDTRDPRQLALMHAAAALFRGAGYTAFDGDLPEERLQAAIAAPYAHTTAPLRRLGDRFVLAICAALSAGDDAPVWAREALPDLNSLMNSSNQLTSQLERKALNAVEAALLANRVGQTFPAVVITGSRDPENGNAPYGTVQLGEPAVEARCEGRMQSGDEVTVRLVEADIRAGRVRFELV